MLVDRSDGRLRRVDPVSDWLLSQRTRNSPNSLKRWAELSSSHSKVFACLGILIDWCTPFENRFQVE